MRAPRSLPVLKTALLIVGVVALPYFALGCASTQPRSIHDASDGPTLVQVMQRVKNAQAALLRMAEAGNSVASALGVSTDELDFTELVAEPRAVCPSPVPSLSRTDDDMGVQSHERRLAKALVMLDDELTQDGHRSIGCAPQRR